MNEIELVQTFVIKDDEDKTSFESKLYDSLFNELAQNLNTYNRVPKEDLNRWLVKQKTNPSLEKELLINASSFIRTFAEDKHQFEILCRNYQSLPTNLYKVIAKSDGTEIQFVLFFKSLALFYVRVIGDSLLVSPLSNTGDIYQVDMSADNISVLKMSNLL